MFVLFICEKCEVRFLFNFKQNMEESKRESSKTKRIKSELRNTVNSYLQKRNYVLFQPFEITKMQQLTYSKIESDVARSNSVLYGCPKSDPAVIDQNFIKFLLWLKEQNEKNVCTDLDKLVGPLFCHFYIEILKGDKNKAGIFFNNHVSSFDKNNCDQMVKELIHLFNNEGNMSEMINLFRSKRTVINSSEETLDLLKRFVLENCHVVFLQVLQNWFDFHVPVHSENDQIADSEIALEQNLMKIQYTKDEKNVSNEISKVSNETSKNVSIQKVLQAIAGLKTEPIPIFCATIGQTKNFVSTGVLRRQTGLIAFSEENALNIMPLNSLDNLLNVEDNNERLKFTDHSGRIYSIDISPSNTILATTSNDHTVCIYDLNKMTLLTKCEGHLGPVYIVKISYNSEYLATGSADNTARLWETSTGNVLRIFVGHNAPILCLDFHPNCLYIATGSADKNIRMWCLDKGVTLRLLYGCKGNVLSVSYSPTGKYLASASDDKKIRIWDLLTSKSILELRYDGAPIYRLIWNKTGRELCTGSNDAIIRIWDLAKMQNNDWENTRQPEPNVTRKLAGRLLHLEYEFGTYGALTTVE